MLASTRGEAVEGRVWDRDEECPWTLSVKKTCLASISVLQPLNYRLASRARNENLSLLLLLAHHLDVHLHQLRFAENLQSSLASHLNICKVNTDHKYIVGSYCLFNRESMQWSSRMAANAPSFCRWTARSTCTLWPTVALLPFPYYLWALSCPRWQPGATGWSRGGQRGGRPPARIYR